MGLFYAKFMISTMILILRLLTFLSWMGMFLVYGVYLSQLIRFANASRVTDFNTRNKLLISKLLNQGYRYNKLCKAFSKFYGRHFHLVSKFNVRIKSLLQRCISEL